MAHKENASGFRIALIICWIGPLPEWFDLFLRSCEMNPIIQILLYTDQEVDVSGRDNISVYSVTLTALRERAEKVLGTSVAGLKYAYKLCDLKPFYGLIFADDLAGFSHWGHCDIDMIFGCFDNFVNEEMLTKYDKIFRYGHLEIYKNTDAVNKRPFMKGGMFSAKDVLEKEEHFSFDEVTGIDRIYRKHGWPYYTQKPYIDAWVRQTQTLMFNEQACNKEHQAFCWENGKVYRYYVEDGKVLRDEWLYLHFQKKKLAVYDVTASTSAFWITPTGFIAKDDSEVTAEQVLRMNPKSELKEENIRYKLNKVKQIAKKTPYEKRIWFRQRVLRIVDSILKK